MRTEDVLRTITRMRDIRNETLRRLIVEHRRLDILCEHVLGYIVKPFHMDMIEHQSAHRETLDLAPRGYGKSTILTVGRTLLEVLANPNIRVLITSKTALQAQVFLREIKHHLEQNQKLLEIFGEQLDRTVKATTTELDVLGKTATYRESTVTTVGVGGPVASRHYDVIIGDDLVDEKNARTEVQREAVKTWYLKTLYPTVVDQTSRVYLVGTRFHPLDLWGHLMAHDSDVHTNIVRAIAADGSTPWPEKFSLERLGEMRSKMGTAIFNSQYQNDTNAMKGAIFKEEWLRTYDEWPRAPAGDGGPRRHEDGTAFSAWEGFDGWAGCDPAATKRTVMLTGRKADTDWWTIAVAYRPVRDDGSYDERLYFRYLWRDRCTKDAYLSQLVRVFQEMDPTPLAAGVEDTAAQEYLVQDLMRTGIPIEPISRTSDKISRAYRIQAYFENGQVLFPAPNLRDACGGRDVWEAAINELLLFPDADHDDLFDAIETCCDLAFTPRDIAAVWGD